MDIKLRSFLLKDLDRIMEIEKSSFSRPWPKSEFEKYKTGFFVAEEDNEVIGFILGRASGGQGVVKKIAIKENHRGQGIGHTLLIHFSDFFKAANVNELAARSRVTNLASVSFLKKNGFEIKEIVENYYPDGTDAYLLKKDI